MLYSEFKDKHNIEICEGDIVMYLEPSTINNQNPKPFYCRIEYIDVSASFRAINDWYGEQSLHEDVVLIIIGNIYENPELIKLTENQ